MHFRSGRSAFYTYITQTSVTRLFFVNNDVYVTRFNDKNCKITLFILFQKKFELEAFIVEKASSIPFSTTYLNLNLYYAFKI